MCFLCGESVKAGKMADRRTSSEEKVVPFLLNQNWLQMLYLPL